MYVLDTDICIYLIKKKPITVLRTLQTKQPDEVVISAVTYAELQFGVENSQQIESNQRALNRFITPLEILAFDVDASRAYGRIRADLHRAGTLIGSLDMMIGAHAFALGAILVTNNVREFQRIRGLTIENWTTEHA